ncbi:hypothetical protein QCA50_012556 [Cerrena zonata]|uniref:Uncharacterized protein n=1 Tax=Cerrena zonata TaxID=2478898 RepID=A0AAW0FVQ1_9APHY
MNNYQAVVNSLKPMIANLLSPDTNCLITFGSRVSGPEFHDMGNESLELSPSQLEQLEAIVRAGVYSNSGQVLEEDSKGEDLEKTVHHDLEDIEHEHNDLPDIVEHEDDGDLDGGRCNNKCEPSGLGGSEHSGESNNDREEEGRVQEAESEVGAGPCLHEDRMNISEDGYTLSKESTPQARTPNIWILNGFYKFNGYHLICRICDNVVPFSHAPTHSKSSGQRMSQFQDKSNRYHTERHNTMHSKTCSDDELRTQLLNKLQELGFNQCDVLDQPGDVSKNSSKWLQSAPFKDVLKLPQDNLDPTITPISPIPGLPVYKAYHCDNCRYLSLHWETFLKNHSGKHAACRNRIDNIVMVQSLSTSISSMRLFMVTNTPPEQQPRVSPRTLFLASQRQVFGPKIPYQACQDLHPCLKNTGMVEFIHQFDLSYPDHFLNKKMVDPKLEVLVKTHIGEDWAQCSAPGFDREALRPLVENGQVKPARASFHPPVTEGARTRYLQEIILLLHALLHHMKMPTLSRDNKTELFVLSAEQKKHLLDLSDALASPDYLNEGKSSLYQCLLSIFFMPHQNAQIRCVFTSPIISFLAVRLAHLRNGLIEMSDVTQIIARLFCGMRLVIAHEYLEKFSNYRSDSQMQGSSSGVPPSEWLKKFCVSHLHMATPCPFAVLKGWSKTISSVVMSQGRPDMIIRNGDELTINGQTFNQNVYKESLKQELRDLTAFLQERVLMGVSLQEAGISTDLEGLDSLDTTTPGYSPFSSIYSPPESFQKFFDLICGRGYLGLRRVGGEVVFDTGEALNWLQDLEKAWSSLRALVHQMGGPPARGEEFIRFLIRNLGGSTNMRNIFLHSTSAQKPSTLVTLASYHKKMQASGKWMLIYRFLPVVLGEILLILLDVARHLETSILTFILRGSPSLNGMIDTQNNHLLTNSGMPLRSKDVSNSLSSFFKRRLGIVLSLQGYRHLSIYFTREWVLSPEMEEKYRRLESSLEDPEALSMYGRPATSEYFSNTASFKLTGEICEEVHRQLGIPTYDRLDSFEGGDPEGITEQKVQSDRKGKRGEKKSKKMERKRKMMESSDEDTDIEYGGTAERSANHSNPTTRRSERLRPEPASQTRKKH